MWREAEPFLGEQIQKSGKGKAKADTTRKSPLTELTPLMPMTTIPSEHPSPVRKLISASHAIRAKPKTDYHLVLH